MEYQFVNPFSNPQSISLQDERFELILTHPTFWAGGATNFFHSLCRERLQAGFALLIVSPAVTNNWNPVFRLDIQRNGAVTQSFFSQNLKELIGQYLPQIVRIRVNNFHGMYFFSSRGCFELSIYQALTSFVLQLKKQRQCELIYYFHDFLTICPFLFLVSDQSAYCDPGPNGEQCASCLKHPHPWTAAADPDLDIMAWRQCSFNFLMECTELIFFSLAGANLLEKVLPGVITQHPERLHIVGQKIEEGIFQPLKPSQREKMIIGVIGTIHEPKGKKQILALQQYILQQRKDAAIVVIGDMKTDSSVPCENLNITGGFNHADLPLLIQKYGVNVTFFSSICPETYSLVVSEIQMMDLPLALYPLGAPAERMRAYSKAAIIPEFSAESTYLTLFELYKKWVRTP